MKKRLISLLLTAAILVGFVPVGMTTVASAAGEQEKNPIDRSTYEALGFVTSLSDEQEEHANSAYLGANGGRTTMNTKNELYFDFQAHKNYGWTLRDNLNLSHTDWGKYKAMGAYKLYGQYRQGDYDHLNEDNGYTDGRTGGQATMIGSSLTSSGSHKSRAYKTAVEFRSATGKEDMVAQLYVTSGANRTDWVAKLELLKYTYNDSTGKYTTSVTSTVTLGAAPALDESGMIFQQYFDALYDITAGDFDGDGIDEIAVYFGTNEVRVYDTGSAGTRLSLKQTIGTSANYGKSEILKEGLNGSYDSDSEHPYGDGTNTHKFVQRAAIITLTAGDLKKDFSDDLVITVSNPQNTTTSEHQNNPYSYIYGYNGSKLEQDCEIPLKVDDWTNSTAANDAQVFKTANAAIGDIDGDSRMELVIGGRLCDAASGGTDDTTWSWGGLIPVKYDHATKSYSIGSATQMELKEYDSGKVLIDDGIDSQVIRYRAPVGMAVADLDGTGSDAPYTFFFSELFTYDPDNRSFNRTEKYLDTVKNQKNNVDEGVAKGQHWVSDVVVGNFNNNENGAEQIIAIVACKESGNTDVKNDWYWYYMSYIAKETETKDGKVYIKSDGDICRQSEGIINQGRSYINRSDVSRASVFVSVAAPDVDDDSILLEHIGTEAFYTKPEVQAVLQSPPYFADVAEVHEEYMNDAATAYANAKGSGEGAQTSVEASLGVYVETEVQAIAGAQLEADVSVTTSYDHQSMDEVETSVEYEGMVGDDYVVMFTVPHLRYTYNATFPDGKKGVMTIEEPLTPATVIVPVETYDAIAATTEGLEPIRGNILTSVPGDPKTYTATPKGKWQAIGDVQALTNAGANSGSIVTVTQTATHSEENSFAIGVEENLKVGGGAAFLGEKAMMGVTQSFAINAGGVYSHMTGTEYSGAVDNLPAGVTGYGFNWQFGISKTKLNGEDIIVVGYQTSNVKQAPSLPQDISVAAVTSGSVTLEWGTSVDAAMYEVYVSGDQNEWLPLEAVPATYATEDGKIYYTVKGLSSGNVYYFRVNACDNRGVRSLETRPVSAQTLSENSTISILSQPEDTTAALSKDAQFKINAQGNGVSTLYFQWYRRDLNSEGKGYGSWKTISVSDSRYAGATGPALTVKSVTMDDQSAQFRCRVSQSANYLYSGDAMLTVSKSPSETSLTLSVNGTAIANGGSVEAASTTVTDIVETITSWEEVVVNGYAKLAAGETESESTNGTYTYTYTEPYVWTKDGKYYADAAGAVEYPVKADFLNGGEVIVTEGDREDFGTPVTLPTAYEEDQVTASVSASAGYRISGTDKYVYVVETTEGAGEDETVVTTCYAAVPYTYTVTEGEGEEATETEVTVDRYVPVTADSENYITVNGADYRVEGLAHVKEQKNYDVVVGQQVQENDGDILTLTAIVTPTDITGKVNFYLENTATGVTVTLPASLENGNWTARRTFDAGETGIYRITASYGGDGTYFSSRSAETLIYVTSAVKSLNLEGGSMTYGQTFELNPTLFHKDGSTKLNSGVTYSVKKDGRPVTGLITGNAFRPESAGTYTVVASYTDGSASWTTTSNIVVNRRTVTVTAPDLMLDVSAPVEARKAAVDGLKAEISNVLPTDKAAVEGCISLHSVAARNPIIKTPGEYILEPVVSATAELEGKYNFVAVPGVLTLSQDTKTVTANAGSNGSARITYTTTVSDSNGTYTSTPLTVESGSLLPVGASVTITASPNAGFGVDKWVVNGTVVNGTETEYTFTLTEETAIDVYFAYTYSALYFSAEGQGALTGAYQGSSAVFNSGDSINANQTVVLTAAPAEGYVVAYWTCDGQVIKAENGVDDYTGSTITVSGVGSTTTYKVCFVAQEKADVTISFVRALEDGTTESIEGCAVAFNGVAGESDTNTFVYRTNKHDNVTITVTLPGNMLVDYWAKDGKVVANAVEEITISDLSGDVEYLVYCETPNQRTLTFDTLLVGENGGVLAEAGTLTATRGGVSLTSGGSLPQGAQVAFTALPAEGYRINKWVVNGMDVADLTTLSVTDNTTVTVCFEKKPAVTVDGGAHGTANGFVDGTAMGGFVEFGDDVQIDITPNPGYIIDTVTVGGRDVSDLLVIPAGGGTDKRYYIIDDVVLNTAVAVTYKAKPIVTAAETTDNGDVTMEATRDFALSEIVSGDYVDFGSAVTVEVTPDKGYVVEEIKADGAALPLKGTANSDVVTAAAGNVQADTAITVTYKAKPIVTVTENADNGTVTVEATRDFAEKEIDSGDYVDFGSALVVTIDPDHGYAVTEVTVDGQIVTLTEVANSDRKTFTVSDVQADTRISVTYTAIDTVAITFGVVEKTAGGGMNGTITAAVERKEMDSYTVEEDATGLLDPVYSGSTVTFTVVPDPGYKVTKWFLNGEEVDQQPVIAVTDGMDDQDVKVQFDLIGEAIDYAIIGDFTDKGTLTATFTPDGGLTQDFASGNKPNTTGVVEFTLSDLDRGYLIEGWYLNGEKQVDEDGEAITAPTFTYKAAVDVGAEITVKLIRRSYTVTFSSANGIVTSTAGDTPVASGDAIVGDTEVTFTAHPKDAVGYAFDGWIINGKYVTEETETLTIAVVEDLEIEAVYSVVEVKHEVTFGVAGGSGTLMIGQLDQDDSPASLKAGSDITFQATPDAGYRVAGWYSDAEGTVPIEGTAVEQNTYAYGTLAAPITVYVKFEPIPEYTIDVTVTGDGTVTALVNGSEAAIADGKVVVKRYDTLTFTAAPGTNNYLTAWTLNGEEMGNELTLDLGKITDNASLTADFAASQSIGLRTEVIGGTLVIKAGFGDALEEINPETGIVIHKGQNIELTLTPDAGKMLDKWEVNGEEQVDWLEHSLRIENLDRDTVIRIICVDQVLHAVPADSGEYVIADIVESPVDHGTDRQIRDRGDVTFVVKNLYPNLISAVKGVTGGESSTAVQNPDGSWTVTVTKVTADIALDLEIEGGKQLNVICGQGGEVVVTLNGQTVSNDRIFAVGDEIVVKARPETTYMLESLTVNGTEFASGKVYTVRADDDAINVTASFKARPAGGGGGTGGGGGGGGAAGPVVYPPVIAEPENGRIEILPESPKAGDEVIIQITPDEGYKAETVIVTDKDGEQVDVEKKSDTEYTFTQPAGSVTVEVAFTEDSLPFVDVDREDYFYNAVYWAVNNGITAGTSPTTFSPDMACTRAQAVMFLWRAAGSPEPKNTDLPFLDVAEDAYYRTAVLWALENGITAGTSDTTFSPDMECSRAHIVTFLWRTAGAPASAGLNPFVDVADAAYYLTPVKWAVEGGITAGTSENTFGSDDDCTRGQIVTFLWRCFGAGK